ncbi:MAG: hypothetical protein Q7K35_05390 [bacterium]|nr:hypothetical protein [bacterium]
MRKQFTIFLILIFVLGLAPVNFSSAADLASRLKGKILLQVESKGEAWYVDPKTGEKNYMANGDEAYNIMRNLGVGITNKDLEKIQNNKNSAVKHSGKIFLQVESKGEAYYVDFSGNLHYLKNGLEAYGVMRNLGLGITNKDLDKIIAFGKNKVQAEININGTNIIGQKNDKTIDTTLVKLSNLNSFIDSAIPLYQDNLNYAYKVIGAIDYYDNRLRDGRVIVINGVNNDQGNFQKAWQLLDKEFDAPLKYYSDVKNGYLGVIDQIKLSITTLRTEKEKNLLAEPVSVEKYWAYYDKLKSYIIIEETAQNLTSVYNEVETYAKDKQADIERYMLMISDSSLAYTKKQLDELNNLKAINELNTIQPTYNNYQPIIYPSIQMPKTTHCTISGDGGVGLQAYISCSIY